jgi:hypothetical protein
MRYLGDQAYSAMLEYKEPVRTGEITAEIGNEAYSTKLLRHVLAASPRFAKIDRKWDLEVRYADKQRPLERILVEIIAEYGCPMSAEQMANQLSSVFERSGEAYLPTASRLLRDATRYFSIPGDLYGLRSWILDTDYDTEEDIVFYNDVDSDTVHSLDDVAEKVDWASDIISLVKSLLEIVKAPVSNRAISLHRWRAFGNDYDSAADFRKLFSAPGFTWLSDLRWANKGMTDSYDGLLSKLADQLSEEIIDEGPAEVVERAEVADEVAPTLSLTISERDIEEVLQIVSAKGEAKMPAILENIFEVSPRDPIYAVAAEGLSDAMRADDRFAWVGTDRWRMADTIPANVKIVPTGLEILEMIFETPEGERIDVEIEDEGLEGGLATELHNPLVQDVADQDAITEQDQLPKSDSARCVVTRHHRNLGTFPLCQIPKSFLPAGPHLIELSLTSDGKKEDIWINRDLGLIFGLDKWYTEEMPESGAVFNLIKTQKADEFEFSYNNETDPQVFVAPNRLQELAELAKEAQTQDLTTFDLMTRIMPYHRKGISFVTLFTEVNLVRRTTRRLVASILSSYYAFYQRPKSSLWHFDEKKVDQGFKKAKRKYVRK